MFLYCSQSCKTTDGQNIKLLSSDEASAEILSLMLRVEIICGVPTLFLLVKRLPSLKIDP